jgi:hypothetical protein
LGGIPQPHGELPRDPGLRETVFLPTLFWIAPPLSKKYRRSAMGNATNLQYKPLKGRGKTPSAKEQWETMEEQCEEQWKQ